MAINTLYTVYNISLFNIYYRNAKLDLGMLVDVCKYTISWVFGFSSGYRILPVSVGTQINNIIITLL